MKTLILTLICLSFNAFSSMYPPDHEWSKSCQSNDIINICQIHTMSGYGLEVFYTGYLTEKTNNNIDLYIKLNGEDNFFTLEKKNGYHYVFLGTSLRNCKYSPPGSNPDSGGDSRRIDDNWVCNYPSEDEKQLFYWTVNDQGLRNRWDLDLAFVSDSKWDSQFGKNYRFSFKSGY